MINMLDRLEKIIAQRQSNPQPGSYTTTLLQSGRDRVAQKVGEEAVEVVVAALSQSRGEQTGEIADLLYHLLVLMADLDISLTEVDRELQQRHGQQSPSANELADFDPPDDAYTTGDTDERRAR